MSVAVRGLTRLALHGARVGATPRVHAYERHYRFLGETAEA